MIPIDKVPNDTDKETDRTCLKLLRESRPWRKAAMVDSLTRGCQELAAAGIRMRHPNASEKDVPMHLMPLFPSVISIIPNYLPGKAEKR
jgi:hypothetical protein